LSKIIVSNTGPLISLEKLEDGYNFIHKLYNNIFIPQKVAEEISEKFPYFEAYIEHYQIKDLIKIRRISHVIDIPNIYKLDNGEIEAISLANELNLELLIEEIKGRSIARSVGITVSGIAGKIGYACIKKIIDKSEAVIKLQKLFESGRINREVYDTVYYEINQKSEK